MESFNPYAPSRASLAGASTPTDGTGKVWRDGKTVVTLHDASLPGRCVKCNQPAELPTKVRTVYWVNPFTYLLLFAGFIILLIVYLVIRKKADIDPGLCAQHKQRRWIGLTVAWLGWIAGLVMLIGGSASDSVVVAIAGLLLIILAIVAGMAWGRFVYVKKITKDEVRLRGFCEDYLDELPAYSDQNRRG
jgi:hypothetical protein